MVEILPREDVEAIKFVADFIEKTRRFELVVDTQKANSIISAAVGSHGTLGGALAKALAHFRTTNNLMELGKVAQSTKKWIEYAWDQGVISEGNGLTGKLEDCRKELTAKENELADISPQFLELKAKNVQLLEENVKLKTENETLKMKIEKT